MAEKAAEDLEKVKLADEGIQVHKYSSSYKRSTIRAVLEGGAKNIGQSVVVGGWVKSGREQGGGTFSFIQLNDGSIFTDLQVYIPKEVSQQYGKDILKTGASLLVSGTLSETPEGAKQEVEVKVTEILHFGTCESATYPVAKKKHTMEFMREKAHLRPRTNTIGAVARVRNQIAYATHNFFQGHGFLYVHTPVITASDCEGAGEMFQVTTLLTEADKALAKIDEAAGEAGDGAAWLAEAQELAADVKALQAEEVEQGDKIRTLKEDMKGLQGEEKSAANRKVQMEVNALKKLKQQTVEAQERLSMVGGIKRRPGSAAIDYSDDFFGRPAFLTVSGQLNGEYYASALSNIYTFGPTFRAENSHTSRHLAEFWMIEPEMAFCTLADDMQCAEDYVRHCCRHVLATCGPDLAYLATLGTDPLTKDNGLRERLQAVADAPFKRLAYTEAIELLQKAVQDGHKFEDNNIEWGIDMGSEHERYICETVFEAPVIVYDYPKDIKAFYMKLNADGRTVAAMDVLVPGIGELVGGSQREDCYETLLRRIREGPAAEDGDISAYEGYLDLRKYGSVPHSGFGLGFERLVMFATATTNIRDVIPFPRYPGNAAF